MRKAGCWVASIGMVIAFVVVVASFSVWLEGCAAQPSARPGPDLEAAGAAILAQDKKTIDNMGQGLQMCMGGVQELLVLCPHVKKDAPFAEGVKACVKEAQANQR